jgi:hypothetical protein
VADGDLVLRSRRREPAPDEVVDAEVVEAQHAGRFTLGGGG